MNAKSILGLVPAFFLSLGVAGVQVGLCEYRGKSCTAEWSLVNYLLGGGSIGAMTYVQGLYTPVPGARQRKRNDKGQFTTDPE